MAAVDATAAMTIEKDSEILVRVDEALADLLVVSYCTENRKFQGVLLDSNKGNLPFGVYSLNPAFTKQNTSSDTKKDKLHSASQRFTYQEPQYANQEPQAKKVGAKGRPQKMTVRLRPRKVLCSNCQGICNENSENVVVKKRKQQGTSVDDNSECISRDAEKKFLMGSMLIPKLSRLHPNEISNAIKSTANPNTETDQGEDRVTQEVAYVDVKEDINCDESMKESYNTLFTNAKRLKICYGEGEGTVVKIPPIGDTENLGAEAKQTKQLATKAAKKALKKAKRQAKKNEIVNIAKPSPKHIGALSPRNNVDPPNNEVEKKHKHKVKHKKKSKLARDENTKNSGSVNDQSVKYFSNIKDYTKISINLRRMSCNSHEKNQESGSEEWEHESVPDFPSTEPAGASTRTVGISPGDIVWGKLVGFPWWPGKVVTVTPAGQANVAWYASTKMSLMPCDSLCLFLDEYKTRFKKKQRGAYKEAVKQATNEAKKSESQTEDPLEGSTLER